MTSKSTKMGSARLNHDPSIPEEIIKSLSIELSNHGFLVEDRLQEPKPQATLAWALPSLTTLLMSAAGGVGILTAKKFADGFLEEIGVKALGSDTAKLLKAAFLAGGKSNTSYHKGGSLKREPYLNLPQEKAESSKQENESEPSAGVKPSPLALEFVHRGNSADDPPWKMKFIFTRDLEDSFDNALKLIPDVFDAVGKRRNEAWTEFKVKLCNPQKFYGRTLPDLVRTSLAHEIMTIAGETSGVFLFDPSSSLWIKVWDSSGMNSPGEVLESFLNAVGHVEEPPKRTREDTSEIE